MRPVHFVADVSSDWDTKGRGRKAAGPWRVPALWPGRGGGALYGMPCMAHHMRKHLATICKTKDALERCEAIAKLSSRECERQFASGPPWAIHASDAGPIFRTFLDTAIRFHNAWPELLAEQGSWQLNEIINGVMTNDLSNYWMISKPFEEVLGILPGIPCGG